jgi:uncharacterized protein (TIGR00730 family)
MRVCVFCGSSAGRDPAYGEAAVAAAHAIVRSGAAVVYGGGRVGLMGIVADAALDAGGTVIGVMPRALVEREIAHQRLHELHVVETLHERKAKMAELADAFIALPGGAGTLDEIFEQWTWGQLGIHAKPCGFLNVKGYFDPLRAMIRTMTAEGFLVQGFADMLSFADSAETLLAAFRSYAPPQRKWSTAETSART